MYLLPNAPAGRGFKGTFVPGTLNFTIFYSTSNSIAPTFMFIAAKKKYTPALILATNH